MGVNRVVPENSSLAHAEVLAIGLAQTSLGTYDLGGPGPCQAIVMVSAAGMRSAKDRGRAAPGSGPGLANDVEDVDDHTDSDHPCDALSER